MTADTLFKIANPVALMGCIALLLAPLAPPAVDLVAGWLLPGALPLAHALLMAQHFAAAPGGFGTLAGVQALNGAPLI